MIIALHRIPDETTETTQVRELLETVGLRNAGDRYDITGTLISKEIIYAVTGPANDLPAP